MASRLLELFDDAMIAGQGGSFSSSKTLADMAVTGTLDASAVKTKIDLENQVTLRVDYSDFANFVFFNSALDYFNISGERMLNEYPYDGTYDDVMQFTSQSDGYQKYLIDAWPKTSGCISFSSLYGNPYVEVLDPLSKINLSGSSYTIELRFDQLPTTAAGTGSVLLQLQDSSGLENLTLYVDGNTLNGASPANTNYYGTPPADINYLAIVMDTGFNAGHRLYTATPSSSVELTYAGSTVTPLAKPVTRMLIGGGPLTLAGLQSVCGDIKIREVRIWDVAKTKEELQANYNIRVYKTPNLLYYGRFTDGYGEVVRDYSGNKLHGVLNGAQWDTAQLGMSPQDQSDPILKWNNPAIHNNQGTGYVDVLQESAKAYDRDNSNLITRMVPEQFLIMEDDAGTAILKNLLYLLGRQFDELKIAIDQFPKIFLAGYENVNDTPDALLEDMLRFWGWEAKGSFLSKEAFQYIFGLKVLTGDQADYDNQRLETSLQQIKNEFWRRTLQNLPYMYKRKGTRESVDALFRIYGIDEKLLRLKEFGLKPDSSIQTNRIRSKKSATALHVTGTMNVETADLAIPGFDGTWSHNMWIRFPSPTDGATIETGSIAHAYQPQGASDQLASLLAFPLGGGTATGANLKIEELRYSRPLTGSTGSFSWISYDGGTTFTSGTWANVPVFDGEWYQLMIHRNFSGSQTNTTLHINKLDGDEVVTVYDSPNSGFISSSIGTGNYAFSIGRHYLNDINFSPSDGSEFWIRNVQVWSLEQSMTEMNDHTLNPFSYGSDSPDREMSMSLNWQFDYQKDSAISGAFDSGYKTLGFSKNSGTFYFNDLPVSFSNVVYDTFEFDYNFIAPPDYGWNEDKIRIVDAVAVDAADKWVENTNIALEFNLIDALNEDISFMMSSMDNWNNVIGEPANRYRENYPQLERIKKQYFSRLIGRINFRAFADFMDFFDRSFIDLVAKLIPAEAKFRGAEFVVESHMLERPKVQYTYRRFEPALVPEGRILIYGHPTLLKSTF